MNEQDILTAITQRFRAAGLHGVVAGIENRTVLLSGIVASPRAREEVERIAHEAAPTMPVQNMVEVERVLSEDRERQWATNISAEQLYNQTGPANTIMESVNTEFTGQSLETDVLPVIGSDAQEDNAKGITPEGTPEGPNNENSYFPPTDPVIGPDQQGNLKVIGGFAPTSMSDQGVDQSFEDTLPGDEALVDAISRELHEDALTTDLNIQIFVRNGVAHLRGLVPTLEDAENAEAVTSRVPGVRSVNEELDVGTPSVEEPSSQAQAEREM